MPAEHADSADAPEQATGHESTRSSKFRFKSKRKHETEDDLSGSSSKHRHHKRRHNDSSRRRSRKESPRYGERYSARTSEEPLDPDAAFRESLFDALADDEGAAYWEGVYGQPIHIYPNTKAAGGDGSASAKPGELEQMDDEEYAAYVRSRMWEKSHQHIIEERQRREEVRRRDRERAEAERDEGRSNARAFDDMIDAALRRGQRRKSQKSWEQAWKDYVAKWERLMTQSKQRAACAPADDTAAIQHIEIPWPVNSGKQQDVSKESVRSFFTQHDKTELARLLKVERVQWHPDKMQQRLGAGKLEESELQSVTAVFQIIDDLWTEIK